MNMECTHWTLFKAACCWYTSVFIVGVGRGDRRAGAWERLRGGRGSRGMRREGKKQEIFKVTGTGKN